MWHLGQIPLPPHLLEEPAMLLIKILAKLYMSGHLAIKLMTFITNSLETKANQCQTSCEIVTQHLH